MVLPSFKIFPSLLALVLALVLHACAIAVLLSDKISIAFAPTQPPVKARIVYEPNHSSQPLKLTVSALIINPQVQSPELPGIEVMQPVQLIDTPLVKIGARLESEFSAEIPIKEISAPIARLSEKKAVRLNVQIYEDGSVGETIIERSSGMIELDKFVAHYAKRRWHFVPATQDGTPVASWKSIDVVFSPDSITVVQR